MDLIGIVAAIVVAIAKPVGLNASRRRVSSRAASATDAMTNGLAAVGFVFAAIAVLIPVAHLFIIQEKTKKRGEMFNNSNMTSSSLVYEPRKAECKHSLVVAGWPRR